MAIAEPCDDAPPRRLPLGAVAAVGLGNALEFYDFLTFSFFAIQIGHALFPPGGSSLLKSLATFGVGFLTRPVGGLVIGIFGDRVGRRPAMLLTFALMGLAIAGLALTPSYAEIGIAAPIMAVLFRLVQGFAVGGEVGPTTSFLVEAVPARHRGLAVAVQYSTQQVSILAAGLVGLVLATVMSPEALDVWGWRIALLLGMAIVPVGLALRRRMPETMTRAEARPARLRELPVAIAIYGLMLLMAGTIGTYVMGYMATWAQTAMQLGPRLAFGATVAQGLAGTTGALIAGALSDRIGRRGVMLPAAVLFAASLVPCFLVIRSYASMPVLCAGTFVMTMLLIFSTTPAVVSIAEALPKHLRCGAVGTIYALAIAIFGGSAQFNVQTLIDLTGSTMVPAWYAMAATTVGIAAMVMMRETAPAITGRET